MEMWAYNELHISKLVLLLKTFYFILIWLLLLKGKYQRSRISKKVSLLNKSKMIILNFYIDAFLWTSKLLIIFQVVLNKLYVLKSMYMLLQREGEWLFQYFL